MIQYKLIVYLERKIISYVVSSDKDSDLFEFKNWLHLDACNSNYQRLTYLLEVDIDSKLDYLIQDKSLVVAKTMIMDGQAIVLFIPTEEYIDMIKFPSFRYKRRLK